MLKLKIMKCLFCKIDGQIKYKESRDLLFNGKESRVIKICKKDDLLWIDDDMLEKDSFSLYEKYPAHNNKNNSKKNTRKDAIKFFSDLGLKQSILDSNTKNILDFGCGTGDFLRKAKLLGFNVYGAEFDNYLNDKLKIEFGREYIKNSEDIIDFGKNVFDIIILNHVIEHLFDPVKIIKSLHILLKENGIIAISTPNSHSLGHKIFKKRWRGLEVPRHRFIFSSSSLQKIFIENSFSVFNINFKSRMARGIFVSSLVPSLEIRDKKPVWRYFLHLIGFMFVVLEIILGIIGLGNLKEEIIILFKK